MKATKLFREFFNSEKSSGIILIVCTVVSLLLSNFFIGEKYLDFWHQKTGFTIGSIYINLTIEHWINDGLMTIFFLMVGLEIERELYTGNYLLLKTHLFLNYHP